MKLSIRIFQAFILIVFLTENIFSQQMPSKYKVGHFSYLSHTVGKNETLGKIAANYHVTVKEIMDVNTFSDPEKIREGQNIVVPDYSDFIVKYPRSRWNFELYTVKKGDKLKSIAKQYDNISADDIANVNYHLDKPVEGEIIRIPVPKKESVKIETDTRDNVNRETNVNPALNFNWGKDAGDANDKPVVENPVSEINDCSTFVFSPKTEFSVSLVVSLSKDDGAIDASGLAFLQGAMIAANEMKDEGLSLKLNVFDAGQKNRTDKLIRSDELKHSHLLIASTSTTDLNKLANFARENKIVMVAPAESKISMVESNPYMILAPAQKVAMEQKIVDKKYDDNVNPILILPEKPDSLLRETYRGALKKRFGTFVEHTHLMTLKQNDLTFKNFFRNDKHNLIFVCSDAENFVSNLMIRLNTLKGYPLSVYGRNGWHDFGYVKRSLFFDLNLHIPQSTFVDYANENAKRFIRSYRGAYNNEPSKSAFLGYDVSYYFLSSLKKFGSAFQDCFTDYNATLLQSQFKFYRNKPGDGFLNGGCFLLEYTSNAEIKRE